MTTRTKMSMRDTFDLTQPFKVNPEFARRLHEMNDAPADPRTTALIYTLCQAQSQANGQSQANDRGQGQWGPGHRPR